MRLIIVVPLRALLSALLCGLLAVQQPALAQQSPDDETEQESGSTAAEPEPPEEPPENNDPFDYEASEEISEDLSVSFPVDI